MSSRLMRWSAKTNEELLHKCKYIPITLFLILTSGSFDKFWKKKNKQASISFMARYFELDEYSRFNALIKLKHNTDLKG